MMRIVALFASSLILASCATHSDPPRPAEEPLPQAVDPRLCAPLEAEPLVVGTIVAPATPAEVDATRAHLTSDAEARSWGRRGWERAAVAQEPCPR